MLSPNFTVITPATDLTLLSLAEMRAAVGQTSGSRDVDVSGSRVRWPMPSRRPARSRPTARRRVRRPCRVFRLNRWWNRRDHGGPVAQLILSQRPILRASTGAIVGSQTYFFACTSILLFDNGTLSWRRTQVYHDSQSNRPFSAESFTEADQPIQVG